MNLRKHLETDTWEIPTVGGGKFKTNIPPKKRTLENSDGTPDWDNIKWQEDFTIKNDDHAREVAMTFADNVS